MRFFECSSPASLSSSFRWSEKEDAVFFHIHATREFAENFMFLNVIGVEIDYQNCLHLFDIRPISDYHKTRDISEDIYIRGNMINNEMMMRFLVGYLIGSIPFSVLASKYILKKDLRKVGSGNVGVSNAYRAGGFWFSLAVAVVDLGKGIIVMQYIFPADIMHRSLGMLAVCVGQMYPIFMNFEGGKGVACFIGSIIGLQPVVGSCLAIGWLALTKLSKMPFVSSMAVLAVSAMFLELDRNVLLVMAMIIVRHKDNITDFIKEKFPSAAGQLKKTTTKKKAKK